LTYGDPVRGSTVARDEAHILLPWSAISSGTQGPSVWVVSADDNTVSERVVTVGRYIEQQIMIESGVEPGEIVVSRGAQLLYPGREVRFLEHSE
ncbi:unnamed protein product, partial [Ectocarpus sp. 12 AP-2014]